MLNVLLTDTRIIVARQSKTQSGSDTQMLFSCPRPQEDKTYEKTAEELRRRLRDYPDKDKRMVLILGSEVVFKEFTHQQASAKALQNFAALEARSVLRQDAERYSISYQSYGSATNNKGENFGMLLATEQATLKAINRAFNQNGFTLESVQSVENCYIAILQQLLPKMMPHFSGAAIDYGYENTLVCVYNKGQLVSVRYLPGLRTAFAPIVKQVLNTTDEAEVDNYLYGGKYSAAYLKRACEALENYNYDILRAVRVVCVPMQFEVENFFLSGELCEEEIFRVSIQSTLALPCTFANYSNKVVANRISSIEDPLPITLLAGAQYVGNFNLLEAEKHRSGNKTAQLIMCLVLTLVAVLGMCAYPVILAMGDKELEKREARLEDLQPVQDALNAKAAAQSKLDGLDAQVESLANFRSNLYAVYPEVLALFGDGYTIDAIEYNGKNGAYTITFYCHEWDDFLTMKNLVNNAVIKDENGESKKFLLNLSLTASFVKDEKDDFGGMFQCQLQFIPSNQNLLPDETKVETPAANNPDSAEELMGEEA